jgi:hypothetical protein
MSQPTSKRIWISPKHAAELYPTFGNGDLDNRAKWFRKQARKPEKGIIKRKTKSGNNVEFDLNSIIDFAEKTNSGAFEREYKERVLVAREDEETAKEIVAELRARKGEIHKYALAKLESIIEDDDETESEVTDKE